MTYLTGRGPKIKDFLSALNIPCNGLTGVQLIIEPDKAVRVITERLVAEDELNNLTEWILREGIQAVELQATNDPA